MKSVPDVVHGYFAVLEAVGAVQKTPLVIRIHELVLCELGVVSSKPCTAVVFQKQAISISIIQSFCFIPQELAMKILMTCAKSRI